MDPQSNQGPQQPLGRVPEDELPPMPPRPQPDWQQGLGVPTPPPNVNGSAPSIPGPQPMQSYGPSQGNMPAQQQEPVISPMDQGMPQSQMAGAPPRKTKKWIVLAILIFIALVAIGVAAYFMFFKNDNSANQAAKQSSSSSSTKATDLSTLNKVSVSLPGGIEGYTERTTSSTTAKDYVSADGNCEFVVGTATATELPGADLNAIVQPQLDQMRNAGATVSGPNAGTALIVKDSSDSKVTYSLPTLNFEFVQGQKHASIHYSAVILKGGDRVVVNRICKNDTGAVNASLLSALDTKAKSVVVTKQQ